MFIIREINPDSKTDIQWVALGMRQTLIEVLGEENGSAMYSMDWLIERVHQHLSPTAQIFLAEYEGEISGHAIARIETDEVGNSFGYFSTIYVAALYRQKGTATALVAKIESWFKKMEITKIVYNTAENHVRLIRLFAKHGYAITLRQNEMVQLSKLL